MVACALVFTFFATLVTGPAGLEYLERRRALRDRPCARVTYLPTAACRTPKDDEQPE